MHTNYRRKIKQKSYSPYLCRKRYFVSKRGNRRTWWRTEFWKRKRAEVLRLLKHARYEQIPDRYRRDIDWRLW